MFPPSPHPTATSTLLVGGPPPVPVGPAPRAAAHPLAGSSLPSGDDGARTGGTTLEGGPPLVPPQVNPAPTAETPSLSPVVVVENTSEDWHDLAGMGVSMALHVVALLLLALFVPLEVAREVAVQIVSSTEDAEEDFEEAEMLPIEIPTEEPENLDEPVPEVTAEVEAVDPTDIVAAGTADSSDIAAFSGPLADLTPGADAFLSEFGAVQAGGPGGGGGFGGAIGRRLAKAGARSGAIQISLAWNNLNDLDLHVVAPSGERIYFAFPRSNCGGHLDVDMNANGRMSKEPVENVYWPRQKAPAGAFVVFVNYFGQNDSANDTPFELHVLVDGVKKSYKGVARLGEPAVRVAEFQRRGPGSASDDEFME